MTVEWVETTKLRPNPDNPREIPADAIQAVADSIRRFGWRQPIVARRAGKVVEAGHTRLMAAELLEIDLVPVVFFSDDATTAAAFTVADNRTGELADWSETRLGDLLRQLDAEDALEGVGFSSDDVASFLDDMDRREGLRAAAEAKETDAIQRPKKPTTKPGNVWVCGKHRVICGDATSEEVVAELLGRARPGLMVTDPPYGVDYDPDWRLEAAEKGDIEYAPTRTDAIENDDRVDWQEAWRHFPGDVAYVWHAGLVAGAVAASLEAERFDLRSQIAWVKSWRPISRGHYHWRHEPCWYAVRKGKTARWGGDRKQSTVWEIERDTSDKTSHATQKPVEAMARAMRNHRINGVYDPFLGSGTTLVAAEMMKRTCYAVELDPGYVDVAVERWQRLTGEVATRESDGRKFKFGR